MSSRPRRSAAQRATAAITDMADRDNERTMSSRSRRSGGASVARGPPSSPGSSQADSNQNLHLTVKVPSNKLRQATSGETSRLQASNSRRRGNVKSYVVESDSDEEEDEEDEEEGEDEIEVGTRAGLVEADDDDEMDEDEDAEGEEVDDMDIDAEGEEEDADGDIDMDAPLPPPPAITISKPPKSAAAGKAKTSPPRAGGRGVAVPVKHTAPKLLDDDDDDDELSELESEPEEGDTAMGEEDAEGEDEEIEDVDAEGEEIEVADEDAEGEDEEIDSEDGSRAGTPDLSKLTARQRARLGDASHEYLKLSDEVQAKKVFTAEELSMRRLEMARRRRNLSEKRNEEVKMETINKLLKKQAPKTNRRHALAGDETPDAESNRADPLFIRWVSSKDGNRIGVPDEMVIGPAGRAFMGGGGLPRGKMVEEVS